MSKEKDVMDSVSKEDTNNCTGVKPKILAQSKNKKIQYVPSAITLAKEAGTDEERIWFLGTAALMLEEHGVKKGGEDVTE